MQRTDFQKFAQLLAAEAEIRNAKPLSEGAILLWWQRMERYDLEAVERAFIAHGRDSERGRFMPQPADLIGHLDGSRSDKSQLAWGKAFEAASRVGAYTDVVFDDPAIHAAIDDLGGWPKFCRSETADLSYLQHRFCESYKAYIGRENFEYPRRLTGDRSPDDVYTKRGLPPPKPAIVGDIERARAVFLGGQIGGKTSVMYQALEAIGLGPALIADQKRTAA